MKKVTSAGGIVIRDNPNKQILLTIFTHIKGLGFPKGHVGEGETFEQAALREVAEETGLTELKIVRKLGVYSKIATERDGTFVEKDIHMYLITSDKLDYHEKAQELYGWYDFDEAIKQMAVKADLEFLKQICKLLV
jgi:8-oxo-dGTP pyrophosphatase MutT (NUDIX family)